MLLYMYISTRTFDLEAVVLYFWQKAVAGVCRLIFLPFFVLYAFSILIFATALFQFGHFPLARFILGCASVWCAFFFFLLQA